MNERSYYPADECPHRLLHLWQAATTERNYWCQRAGALELFLEQSAEQTDRAIEQAQKYRAGLQQANETIAEQRQLINELSTLVGQYKTHACLEGTRTMNRLGNGNGLNN